MALINPIGGMGGIQRLFLIATFLSILSLMIGVTGYALIEEHSLLDAFYMSVITLSTVGFKEILPLSDFGKLFTGVYILWFCI